MTKAEAEVHQLLTSIRSKVDEKEFTRLMTEALATLEDPPGFLNSLSGETVTAYQMSADLMAHRLSGRSYSGFGEFVEAINTEVRVELMAQTIISLAPVVKPLIVAWMRGEGEKVG